MSTDTQRLGAPAKLNLHLGVHAELDERRYHRVDSLMVSLDLADYVSVTSTHDAGGSITVGCTPAIDIPQEKNTCYRAGKLLAELFSTDASTLIEIEKHIPDQAGLGGSSSDAAATIKALATIWNIDADDPRLFQAARQTGADVPFFLDGAPAFLVGAGDIFKERFDRPKQPIPVALMRPEGPGVSTPAAYAAFDQEHEDPKDPEPLCALLRSGNWDGKDIATLLVNNLEPIAMRLHPGIRDMRLWLAEQDGVLGCQVTGSGSCMFAICSDEEACEQIVCHSREKFKSWAKTAHIV